MRYIDARKKIMSLPPEKVTMTYRGYELETYIEFFVQNYSGFNLYVYDDGEGVKYIASINTLHDYDKIANKEESKGRDTAQDACIDLIAKLDVIDEFVDPEYRN
jgi:hypothetical protein